MRTSSKIKELMAESKVRRQELARKYDEKSPTPVEPPELDLKPKLQPKKKLEKSKSINIGKITLDYIENVKIKPEVIKKSSAKQKKEPVKQTRFRLSEEYLLKLKNIAKPKNYKYKDFGRDRKLKFLIDFYRKETRRTNDQVKIIKSAIKQFKEEMNKQIASHKKTEEFIKNETSLKELISLAERIRTIAHIQCLGIDDLKDHLSTSELNDFNFSQSWAKRVRGELDGIE